MLPAVPKDPCNKAAALKSQTSTQISPEKKMLELPNEANNNLSMKRKKESDTKAQRMTYRRCLAIMFKLDLDV